MNRTGGSRVRSTGKPERVGASGDPTIKYREALAWLYQLQRFGIKLGLENIQRLIAELHVDLAQSRVIHVAGTNGKGSVCAMIDSICRAANYQTGLFTSPHLVTFRERIRVNGEIISEDAVATGLTIIRDLLRDWDPHPTFFEITTALALKHFTGAKIDIVILEIGLGGRLDATNAVQSTVAVITPIDLDHQKWLGETLAEIASEKAGIIKPKTAVVSASQLPEAAKVIRSRAAECEAPSQIVEESYEQSPIALRGAHQKQNAALAIAAIRAGKIDIDDAAIARGLLSVEWPARFQCWDDRIIIDGAHNPASARVLAETWRENFGEQRATLILAVLSDKDLRGICEALAPISDFIFLPHIRSERAVDPKELANVLVDLAMKHEVCADIAEALAKARALPSPILLTGSLHFAGEALAHLQGQPAAFEECAQ
ncbi:MAG: folylpolyglutamate synthase/dihydrofolate synthase family protein [Spartobacteria bacterium]